MRSYPTGDAVEYILCTEAFYKHKTPDIRAKDCKSFKTSFTKILPWDSVYKPNIFDSFENFVSIPNKKFGQSGDSQNGLYVAKNGKIYGYHFFTYSLLNVPARYFLGLLHKNPLSTFKITNTILVILTCFILIFFTPFNIYQSCFLVFSFYFSSVYWYLDWAHSELFTVCFVTVSLWLFFQKKFYISLLLMSIAVTQNQPLMFMLLFMALTTLSHLKFGLKEVLKVVLCCFISILPPLFYYYNYETFSLINKSGYLDSQYQTLTRLLGFYFDLNQGIILAIPLVLVLYLYFLLKDIYTQAKQRKISLNIFFLITLLAITFTVSAMGNWNHGQAIINRYATWMSAMILIHFLFLIQILNNLKKTIILSGVAITQMLTALYHNNLNNYEIGHYYHKPIAKFMLNNFPTLYNPDPFIFGIRTSHEFLMTPEASPIIYFGAKKEICKIMCYKNRIDELSVFGIPKKDLEDFKRNKKAINGWVYINKGDFTSDYSNEKIYQLALYLKAKKVITLKIKENPAWYNHVKENAKTMKISEDSALVIDGFYVLNLEEQNNK